MSLVDTRTGGWCGYALECARYKALCRQQVGVWGGSCTTQSDQRPMFCLTGWWLSLQCAPCLNLQPTLTLRDIQTRYRPWPHFLSLSLPPFCPTLPLPPHSPSFIHTPPFPIHTSSPQIFRTAALKYLWENLFSKATIPLCEHVCTVVWSLLSLVKLLSIFPPQSEHICSAVLRALSSFQLEDFTADFLPPEVAEKPYGNNMWWL